MTELVLNISRNGIGALTFFPSLAYKKVRTNTLPLDIIFLGITMVIIQILDGILTGVGVAQFGTTAEGNFLIRNLMELIGFVPALIIAKTAAVGVIAALCVLSQSVLWLKTAMKVVVGIYLAAAIVPWMILLTA